MGHTMSVDPKELQNFTHLGFWWIVARLESFSSWPQKTKYYSNWPTMIKVMFFQNSHFCECSSRKFVLFFHVLLKHTVTLVIYTFMLPNFDMVQFVIYLAKSLKTNLIGPSFFTFNPWLNISILCVHSCVTTILIANNFCLTPPIITSDASYESCGWEDFKSHTKKLMAYW